VSCSIHPNGALGCRTCDRLAAAGLDTSPDDDARVDWREAIDFDRLREIADRLRSEGEHPVYGYFPGGDPRDFSPDPECSTDEEQAAWRAACEAWESGVKHDVGGPCQWAGDKDAVVKTTTSHYGLGTYVMRDETMSKLAQDLDDWIDRARQVSQ
jgi:hypothetical protein